MHLFVGEAEQADSNSEAAVGYPNLNSEVDFPNLNSGVADFPILNSEVADFPNWNSEYWVGFPNLNYEYFVNFPNLNLEADFPIRYFQDCLVVDSSHYLENFPIHYLIGIL